MNNLNDNIENLKNEYLSDSALDNLKLRYINFRVGSKRKSALLEKMAARLEDGDSMSNVLSSLSAAYQAQQPNSWEAKFVQILYERFTFKPKLEYMVSPFFDEQTVGVVKAISKETAASTVLKMCVSNLRRKNEMKAAGFIGIVGPIVGILLIIAICSGAHLFVYESLFKGLKIEPTPMLTFARGFTESVYIASPFIIFGLLIYLFYIRWSLPNQIKRRPVGIPPWNVIDSINSAITLQTFGALLKVGIPATDALRMLGTNSTPFVSHWCQKMRISMIHGKSTGKALACDFFSKEPRIEVESYASTEGFTNKIDLIAEEVFKSTEKLVTRMTASIMMFCLICVLTVNGIVGLSLSSIGQVAQ
ncbi:hypothetical protein F7Q91_03385 [Vibrio chagasii]|uniref:Type II secretion system protein GspF domain-containing protein n=1 Tax=Vibrio chagasii TaxID=170679 RepID=A0A7V7NX04_9VIBR|nr:hypothetical protein [Vibrio chagasii]KAB0482465.1 hypothetical protein F7Q91_03385 [Vibrio chagasii]